MKLWYIIGPLGDCPIQAPTPAQAAALYPTVKGHKTSVALEYIVTCHETGERFKVQAVQRYEAVKIA